MDTAGPPIPHRAPPPLPARPVSQNGAAPHAAKPDSTSSGSKRGRPVITVVGAVPMDQVGFRGETATKPLKSPASPPGRPEITIVGAKPLGQTDFKKEGSSMGNESKQGTNDAARAPPKRPGPPPGRPSSIRKSAEIQDAPVMRNPPPIPDRVEKRGGNESQPPRPAPRKSILQQDEEQAPAPPPRSTSSIDGKEPPPKPSRTGEANLGFEDDFVPDTDSNVVSQNEKSEKDTGVSLIDFDSEMKTPAVPNSDLLDLLDGPVTAKPTSNIPANVAAAMAANQKELAAKVKRPTIIRPKSMGGSQIDISSIGSSETVSKPEDQKVASYSVFEQRLTQKDEITSTPQKGVNESVSNEFDDSFYSPESRKPVPLPGMKHVEDTESGNKLEPVKSPLSISPRQHGKFRPTVILPSKPKFHKPPLNKEEIVDDSIPSDSKQENVDSVENRNNEIKAALQTKKKPPPPIAAKPKPPLATKPKPPPPTKPKPIIAKKDSGSDLEGMRPMPKSATTGSIAEKANKFDSMNSDPKPFTSPGITRRVPTIIKHPAKKEEPKPEESSREISNDNQTAETTKHDSKSDVNDNVSKPHFKDQLQFMLNKPPPVANRKVMVEAEPHESHSDEEGISNQNRTESQENISKAPTLFVPVKAPRGSLPLLPRSDKEAEEMDFKRPNKAPMLPSKGPRGSMPVLPQSDAQAAEMSHIQGPVPQRRNSTSFTDHKPSNEPMKRSSSVKMKPPRPGAPPPPRPGPPKINTQENQQSKSDEKPKRVSPPRAAPPSPKPKQTITTKTNPNSAPSLPPRPGPGHPLYHYVVEGPHGIAQHDYVSDAEGDLNFKAGDVIILLKEIDNEWMQGRNVDQEGMFPVAFIQIIEPLPAPQMGYEDQSMFAMPTEEPDTGHGPRCRARFDFDGEGEGDLTFEAGQIIQLLQPIGEEWMKGECHGRVGCFPIAFVEIIEDLPRETTAMADEANEKGDMVTSMFDFEGQDGELSFKAGSQIKVLHMINDEWLLGEIDGKRGNFPSNFIDRIPEGLTPVTSSSDQAQIDIQEVDAPHCIAMHEYHSTASGDLNFVVGDKILLLEHVDADWLKGSLHGQEGIFPKGFVDIIEDTPVNAVDSKTTGCAKALFDYEGQADEDLSFKVGDTITLLERISDDWLKGQIGTNTGLFPAAFVEILEPLP